MTVDAAFLICAERPIEQQAVLLAQSIRDLAGDLRKAPIYTFQPRSGFEITAAAKRCLRALDVEHVTTVKNEEFKNYPPANKPIVCEYAEKHLPHEHLILCDTDKLIVNELNAIGESPAYEVAMRPTHKKGIGYVDRNDRNFIYWKELWEHLGIERPVARVQTTISREDIVGYWNSGLVVVRKGVGLFTRWNDMMKTIKERRIEPAASVFYLDQIALAAAVHDTRANVQSLPLGYNYPIHRYFYKELPADALINSSSQLKTVHYHGLINGPYFKEMFDGIRGGEYLSEWLLEQTRRYKMKPHNSTIHVGYRKLRLYLYRKLKERR